MCRKCLGQERQNVKICSIYGMGSLSHTPNQIAESCSPKISFPGPYPLLSSNPPEKGRKMPFASSLEATMIGIFPSRSFILVCAAPARLISIRTQSPEPATAAQCSGICFFLFVTIGFAPLSSRISIAGARPPPAARCKAVFPSPSFSSGSTFLPSFCLRPRRSPSMTCRWSLRPTIAGRNVMVVLIDLRNSMAAVFGPMSPPPSLG
mmetsp:Transcript_29404/g.49827  ORF Transcript_29404/g.49827 Transcript_29404/m.49827 type:complete len:207 (-) Transcript_29404:26-646(-)